MGKHLMRVDKGWKEIMNLYPISKLGKVGALILVEARSKKGQITTYPPMIWPKFKLPTHSLKFDTLPIWGLLH